jgi:hypothetical protein
MFAMSQVMAIVQLAIIRARQQKNFLYTKSRHKEPQKCIIPFQLESQVPFGRPGDLGTVHVDTSGAKSERISETWLLRGRGGLRRLGAFWPKEKRHRRACGF